DIRLRAERKPVAPAEIQSVRVRRTCSWISRRFDEADRARIAALRCKHQVICAGSGSICPVAVSAKIEYPLPTADRSRLPGDPGFDRKVRETGNQAIWQIHKTGAVER